MTKENRHHETAQGRPEIQYYSAVNRLSLLGIMLVLSGFLIAYGTGWLELILTLPELYTIPLTLAASVLAAWGTFQLYLSGTLFQQVLSKKRNLDRYAAGPATILRQLSLRPHHRLSETVTLAHERNSQTAREALPIHTTLSYIRDSLAEAVELPPHDAHVSRTAGDRSPMQDVFENHTTRDPNWSTLTSRDFAAALTIVEESWYTVDDPQALAGHRRKLQKLLDHAFENRENALDGEHVHDEEVGAMKSALDDTRGLWPDDAVVHRDELRLAYAPLLVADPKLEHTPAWATAAIHVELTNLQRIGAGHRQGLPAERIASEQRLAWARLNRAIQEAVRAGDEVAVAEPLPENIHFDPTQQYGKS